MRHFVWIFIVCISFTRAYTQDAAFSQLMFNPIYLNPALAGSETSSRFCLNYRKQWIGMQNTFVTYSASIDNYVKSLNGGLGLLVMKDTEGNGLLNHTFVNGMYAYRMRISKKSFIQAGFQAAYVQRSYNVQNLVFSSMINRVTGEITTSNTLLTNASQNYTDISVGFAGMMDSKYQFGASFDHLAQLGLSTEDKSYDPLPIKYTLYFGTSIDIDTRGLKKKELFLSPNLVFQQQGDDQQLNYGLNLIKRNFLLGTWFRQDFKFQYDALIFMLGFKYNGIKAVYSYDFTVSKLAGSVSGSHEISIQILFSEFIGKSKAVPCPTF